MQIINTAKEAAEAFRGKPDGTAGLRKAVLVLPGFMGSQLFAAEDIPSPKGGAAFRKDERLWIYNPLMDGCFKLTWDDARAKRLALDNRFLEDDRIAALACDINGKPLNRLQTAGLDDRVRGDMGADGQYGTVNLYTDLMLRLKEVYADAHFLPYDWRLGARAAVNELRPALDMYVAQHDVTYIIAHSMGGLVALEYIRQRGNAHGIRFISLGTPFFGAPSALFEIETGKALPLDFGVKALQKIAKNLRAGYELFPTVEYGPYTAVRRKGDEAAETQSRADTELFLRGKEAGLNVPLLNAAARFHAELSAAKLFGGLPHACAIVGHGLDTPGMVVAHMHGERLSVSMESDRTGDGTVPLASGGMNGQIPASRLKYVREKHTGLVTNDAVTAFILAKTDNWEFPDSSRFGYDKSVVKSAPQEPENPRTFELTLTIRAQDVNFDFARFPANLYDVYDKFAGALKGDCRVSKRRVQSASGRGGDTIVCAFDINPHDDACKYCLNLRYGPPYTISADIRHIGSKSVTLTNRKDTAVALEHVLIEIT